MTEITWTNCADAMPTLTMKVIIRHKGTVTCGLLAGSELALWKTYANYQWTPYTPEKWRELSK